MIEFFEWFQKYKYARNAWLVFGQGPSFTQHQELHKEIAGYHTFGLNRTCRERRMFLNHIIDIHVLREIPDLPSRMTYLVMPWGPHLDFKPTQKATLEDFAAEIPELKQMNEEGRLLWYNLSSGGPVRAGSEVVKVDYFSGEAAVRLLAMAGVKKIRTLGMDGGTGYSKEFDAKKPFAAGHNTFDLQNLPIKNTVEQLGVDFGPLVEQSA